MSVRERSDVAEVGRLPRREAIIIALDEHCHRPSAELRPLCQGACQFWGAPLGGRP
jgi:hypothetical protein